MMSLEIDLDQHAARVISPRVERAARAWSFFAVASTSFGLLLIGMAAAQLAG